MCNNCKLFLRLLTHCKIDQFYCRGLSIIEIILSRKSEVVPAYFLSFYDCYLVSFSTSNLRFVFHSFMLSSFLLLCPNQIRSIQKFIDLFIDIRCSVKAGLKGTRNSVVNVRSERHLFPIDHVTHAHWKQRSRHYWN